MKLSPPLLKGFDFSKFRFRKLSMWLCALTFFVFYKYFCGPRTSRFKIRCCVIQKEFIYSSQNIFKWERETYVCPLIWHLVLANQTAKVFAQYYVLTNWLISQVQFISYFYTCRVRWPEGQCVQRNHKIQCVTSQIICTISIICNHPTKLNNKVRTHLQK